MIPERTLYLWIMATKGGEKCRKCNPCSSAWKYLQRRQSSRSTPPDLTGALFGTPPVCDSPPFTHDLQAGNHSGMRRFNDFLWDVSAS
jgi:hypothetical protein